MTNVTQPVGLSGKQIDTLVKDNWERFYERGVVLGVGVSHREGELRFIVRVGTKEDAARLARRFNGEMVDNLPVHVEMNRRVQLAALPSDEAPLSPTDLTSLRGCVQWLCERPVVLVLSVAAALSVVAATILLFIR